MMKRFISDISKKEFPISERVSGESVRSSVLKLIQKKYPDFSVSSYLSIDELNHFRREYVTSAINKEFNKVSGLEKKVLDSINEDTILSDQIKAEDSNATTLGQKLADRVASFGGSWTFIILFIVFILFWIGINSFLLLNKGFDPYPFILLNLFLSCLAALQAPIIMMSQNRKDGKDRERAKKDYMVNLKAEIEIRALHEKMDHLIIHQQQGLMEIQNIQIELMNDILRQIENKKDKKEVK